MNIKYIIALCTVFSFGLYNHQLYGRHINILIFPDKTEDLQRNGKKHHVFRVDVQSFKPDFIWLVSEKTLSDPDYSNEILSSGETPTVLQELLDQQKANSYPLRWHKKFKNLSEYDELRILIHKKETLYDIVPLAPELLEKILNFMALDQQSPQLDCFAFIMAIKANFVQGNGSDTEEYNFFDFIEHHDRELEFLPGDAIACYTVNGNVATFPHFALAIGNGMYLAKNAKGGPLAISDKQTMLAMWDCDHCCKIKEKAFQNQYLWKICKSNMS